VKFNSSQGKHIWLKNPLLAWIQMLLDSYAHWTQTELIARDGIPLEQAQRLFVAPFVVASHGVEAEPILNYGNALALQLWEMNWEEFTATPSRLTAEPANQTERARMLREATRDGMIRNYQGARISKSGSRFLVEKATVWNVIDHDKNKIGQAVTFDTWTPLLKRQKV
jgi:hypothetical protein